MPLRSILSSKEMMMDPHDLSSGTMVQDEEENCQSCEIGVLKNPIVVSNNIHKQQEELEVGPVFGNSFGIGMIVIMVNNVEDK